MDKTALVLVDIQNDYFPDGRNVLHNAPAAAANARLALDLFRKNRWPVFHIQHVSVQQGATFFLPDTGGANIHQTVEPAAGEAVVVKHAPDSFLKTDLQQRLEAAKIQRLVICGMMSHMCIDTTVRSAKARGYEVILLHDACTTRSLSWDGAEIPAPTVHAAFMAALSGAFATVIATEKLAAAIGS